MLGFPNPSRQNPQNLAMDEQKHSLSTIIQNDQQRISDLYQTIISKSSKGLTRKQIITQWFGDWMRLGVGILERRFSRPTLKKSTPNMIIRWNYNSQQGQFRRRWIVGWEIRHWKPDLPSSIIVGSCHSYQSPFPTKCVKHLSIWALLLWINVSKKWYLIEYILEKCMFSPFETWACSCSIWFVQSFLLAFHQRRELRWLKGIQCIIS